MARIRSIKPEFPQSESMGKVSRSARLLFVMLWPICDDHGRTRAASRMLASLLFPYDDDAPTLIDGWLGELEREQCIRRYEVNGSAYLEICNWLIHQKIDKPSKPQFPEPPATLANTREDSSEEGKGREGKGGDIGASAPSAPPPPANPSHVDDEPPAVTTPAAGKPTTALGTRIAADWTPTAEQIAWARGEFPGGDVMKEAIKFRDHWLAKAGKDGRKADWAATWRTWIRNAETWRKSDPAPSQPGSRQELSR
jgi:hypothetical protein